MRLANNIEPGALPDGMVPVEIDVTPMDNSKISNRVFQEPIRALTVMHQ